MKSISDYFVDIEFTLLGLLAFSLVVKAILYYSIERNWDSLKFFYFTQSDLRMTTLKTLRSWRKRQNVLSNVMVLLVLLFAMLYSFHSLVQND